MIWTKLSGESPNHIRDILSHICGSGLGYKCSYKQSRLLNPKKKKPCVYADVIVGKKKLM